MYNDQKPTNYLLATFICTEILYLIIMGFVISSLFVSDDISTNPSAQPIAYVSDLPPFVSNSDSITIESSLYPLMLQNTSNKQLSDQDAFAIVDANSETTYHFNNQGFTLYSAILNAPNLDQVYRLFYGYPDEGNNSFQQFTGLICVKAPVAPCASASNYTESDIAHNFLPYVETDKFSLSFREGEPQTIYINPVLPTDDKIIQASYIEEAKSAVRTLGLTPDSFHYHVVKPSELTFVIDN